MLFLFSSHINVIPSLCPVLWSVSLLFDGKICTIFSTVAVSWPIRPQFLFWTSFCDKKNACILLLIPLHSAGCRLNMLVLRFSVFVIPVWYPAIICVCLVNLFQFIDLSLLLCVMCLHGSRRYFFFFAAISEIVAGGLLLTAVFTSVHVRLWTQLFQGSSSLTLPPLSNSLSLSLSLSSDVNMSQSRGYVRCAWPDNRNGGCPPPHSIKLALESHARRRDDSYTSHPLRASSWSCWSSSCSRSVSFLRGMPPRSAG